MIILKTIAELRQYRRGLTGLVGLVPTMGYLHEGHLSLVRASVAECAQTVVSIFVNPTQFGPGEDFKSYPRDTERDLALLAAAGTDAVFLPEAGEMYPPGTDTVVVPGEIAGKLEGAARPGHFQGVATVVLKLFNLVQPDYAYFGQKDAQQVAVIQKMVADLNIPVGVTVMPTVRESDGLAMSSRNTYLNPAERQAALILYRSLQLAADLIAGGEADTGVIKGRMTDLIETVPSAAIDYVSLADADSLTELAVVARPVLISLAARIGKTRLIDNIILK
ncbi:MAG: pantoate--beta-alanine ligase [Dehalogenimonas sp.]|uniref:Pantothenate synthetase n=1 Tax=Candidatus Dehalogenimonas loeffleri TaxID=3127115 RepID=A0ABZ2J2P4_9CHLR|nr:pantoate--beta-alanine ligase [Dehalogenimonas sp.]